MKRLEEWGELGEWAGVGVESGRWILTGRLKKKPSPAIEKKKLFPVPGVKTETERVCVCEMSGVKMVVLMISRIVCG